MCPKKLQGVDKVEKCAEIILNFINLPDDQYRLGNSKVPLPIIFFKNIHKSQLLTCVVIIIISMSRVNVSSCAVLFMFVFVPLRFISCSIIIPFFAIATIIH